MRVLESSDNPKHRNSKFLQFLKKIEQGAYKFENDQLVKDTEKLAQFKQDWTMQKQEEEMKMKQ